MSKGVQGVVITGLGEIKTAGAIGVGLLGAAGVLETEGASLSADLAAGYLVISTQGQVLGGGGQLFSNSLDYLTELQPHAQKLATKPAEWMPWNHRETLERIVSLADSA